MRAAKPLAFIGILVIACFSDERGYSVRVRNTGLRQVVATRVQFGNFASDVGVLIAHSADTEFDVREPLPKAAVVEWRDAAGSQHRETVNVSLPRGFKGVLVFEIDGANHVHVVTESPPKHIVP